jgi:hypothetical protein
MKRVELELASRIDSLEEGLNVTFSGTGTNEDPLVINASGGGAGTDDQVAAEVPYDNSTSGLAATEVQTAIDLLENEIDAVSSGASDGVAVSGVVDVANQEIDMTVASPGSDFSITLTNLPNLAGFSDWDQNSADDFDGAWLSLTGVPAGFSDNVDNVDDADPDAFNEIQDLTWNGGARVLTLSDGGGSVTITDDSGTDDQNATEVDYDNTTSGLAASDVQTAIDLLENEIDAVSSGASDGVATGGTLDVGNQEIDITVASPGSNFSIPLSLLPTLSGFSGWDTNSSDDFSGAWGDLTGVPAGFADNVDNVDDADPDAFNEIQDLNVDFTGDFLTFGLTGSAPLQFNTLLYTSGDISGGGSQNNPLTVDFSTIPVGSGWLKDSLESGDVRISQAGNFEIENPTGLDSIYFHNPDGGAFNIISDKAELTGAQIEMNTNNLVLDGPRYNSSIGGDKYFLVVNSAGMVDTLHEVTGATPLNIYNTSDTVLTDRKVIAQDETVSLEFENFDYVKIENDGTDDVGLNIAGSGLPAFNNRLLILSDSKGQDSLTFTHDYNSSVGGFSVVSNAAAFNIEGEKMLLKSGDISFNVGNGVVTDDLSSKGLEYAADYSANFTNESLVTKRYVDAQTGGGSPLTQEQVQDFVGPMLPNGTHSDGFSFTYDDPNGEIDLIADVDLTDIGYIPNHYDRVFGINYPQAVDLGAHLEGIDLEFNRVTPNTPITLSTGLFVCSNETGVFQKIDMTGLNTITITVANPVAGGAYVALFQNADNTDTVNWPANFRYENGSTIPNDILSDGRRMVQFIYDGTNFYVPGGY